MGRKSAEPVKELAKTTPALDPIARQNQLIALAEARAEQQLRDGTASAQVITHYLKLGTLREQRELEKLQYENELLQAKQEAIKSQANSEQLYQEALAAFRGYAGLGFDDNNGEY